MDPSSLLYGQIRTSNYAALRALYGHDPPWPLATSPHASLVDAVMNGGDPASTPYYEYIKMTPHPDPAKTLAESVRGIERLLHAGQSTPVALEHDSVLDGNHRVAVAIATSRALSVQRKQPYQTLEFPDQVIDGRRLPSREIPVDMHGKRVLDLGCAQGMMSVTALRQGAEHVVSVDRTHRSTTWQLRNAWRFEERMRIIVSTVETFDRVDADVVLAFSIVRHITPEAFARHARGRICVLETHYEGDVPPPTHRWSHAGYNPYNRRDHARRREILIGTPI